VTGWLVAGLREVELEADTNPDLSLVWASTFGAAMARQDFDRWATGVAGPAGDEQYAAFVDEAWAIADRTVEATRRDS
jgi:hypothetical protein